jgi:hypothetical protein
MAVKILPIKQIQTCFSSPLLISVTPLHVIYCWRQVRAVMVENDGRDVLVMSRDNRLVGKPRQNSPKPDSKIAKTHPPNPIQKPPPLLHTLSSSP